MDFIRNDTNVKLTEPTVLTIGKFDGLHMGHKKLLEYVDAKKKEKGLKSVIFTFDMPPSDKVSGKSSLQITTLPEKELCFTNVGIDYFIECPFTDEVRMMEAEDFVRKTVENLNVKAFVVGTDCRFGHNRSGDYKLLEQMSDELGYDVVVVQKKQYEGRDISSTFIREEIEVGNIEKANLLLGYPFFIMEEVTSGNHLGHTIGFPTINQVPPVEKALPPKGVYASAVVVRDRIYAGMTNIGVKPTIEGENALGVETNIFDFDEDIYGETVRVRLFSFIRPEKKFGSLDELKAQLAVDRESVNRVMSAYELKI
ncbi:MAG: bifunctional riboflavin kinase/FAD synthetase [Eubacterium sp.]|nr:bifunctional riboflavin kinase/FAD synthetase [Eubacterium sp.]